MAARGSPASGAVSIAVTKMASGVSPEAGTRLNGRVRNAVHRPEASNRSRITALAVVAGSSGSANGVSAGLVLEP